MDNNTLLRYSRQIFLPEIGIAGQNKLQQSSVLIIGLGGLGSPVVTYLAAAGLGHLVLVDDDQVDLSNLQRQVLYTAQDVGQPKTRSAQQRLEALNPDCEITTYSHRLTQAELNHVIQKVDLVADCSDNFDTRFTLNATCYTHKKPLVSGAAIGWEGQISVFLYQANTACYRCLYPDHQEDAPSCTDSGVIGPLVGTIGSLQALEAIKMLLSIGDVLQSRLIRFDGLRHIWHQVNLRPDPACPVCGNLK